jgi:hypothetical protein
MGPDEIGRLAFGPTTEAGITVSNLMMPEYLRAPKMAFMYFERDEAGAQRRLRSYARESKNPKLPKTPSERSGRVVVTWVSATNAFRRFVMQCVING